MKQLHYLIAAFMLVLLTGCPFGAPEAIKLGYKQPSSITLNYNETSSSIQFVADAEWHVTISPVYAKPTSWIHFDNTTGNAGSNTLTFSVEENMDSESRAANIIISCLDASVTVLVTQLSEKESSDKDEDGETSVQRQHQIDIREWSCSYVNGVMTNENGTLIKFLYSNAESTIPCEMHSETHLQSSEDTPPMQTIWQFKEPTYGEIVATSVTQEVWSLNVGTETWHQIKHINEGNYEGMGSISDANAPSSYHYYSYSLESNADNRIYRGSYSFTSDKTEFKWENGNITSIIFGDQVYNFTYHDKYANDHKIDLNWLIVSHSELSNALGDNSRIWAIVRQIGASSRKMVQEVTTPTSRFVVEYDRFTEHVISCTVYEYQGDELVGETQYTIR